MAMIPQPNNLTSMKPEYSTPPIVTVVICTFNRARYLKPCLLALSKQTAPASAFEVVVVDNNSTDQTAEVVAEFTRKHHHFRYLKETRQGLSIARNRGIVEARADWVAYIDDDGEAFPDCIEEMIVAIERGRYDAFGGRYYPLYPPGKPSWYLDAFASNEDLGDVEKLMPKGSWATGCICAFKVSDLKHFGGFPPEAQMMGDALGYGDEVRVQVRMANAGGRLGFLPQVRIYHWVRPNKYRLSFFYKSAFAAGRDSLVAFDHNPSIIGLVKSAGSMLKRCLVATARLLAAVFLRTHPRPGACVAEILRAVGWTVGLAVGQASFRRST